MDKIHIRAILKSFIWGIILAAVLITAGLIIDNFSKFIFIDVLFVEGLLFVILGVLSLIGGFPAALSLKGLGRNDTQYITNINMEVTNIENKISDRKYRNTIISSFNLISLITGGMLCIILDVILLTI